MSELRQNLATKDWVIIAHERAARPDQYASTSKLLTGGLEPHRADCPFCPGNEAQTADEIIRWPADGPWRLRVFTNKYSALRAEVDDERCMTGIKRRINGFGYHEALVESPLHNTCPALQSPEEIHLTLKAFQARGRRMIRDPHIQHVVYYKNHGAGAGASIVHPHCQMLGLPMIPLDTRLRIEGARQTIDDSGSCPHCTMVATELADRQRLVAHNQLFVAFVPYAANSPFHLWIVPRLHRPSFLAVGDDELACLAGLMREVFGKLYHALGDPDFNYIIRSAPYRDLESDYLHWYLTIIPRVTKTAGFELGSGMHINPSLPEASAEFLRDADPGSPVTSIPPELHRAILSRSELSPGG